MKHEYSKKLDGTKNATLNNGQRSKYFKVSEFKNVDYKIDRIVIDDKTATILENLRIEFGVPVYIQVANRNLPEVSYHNPDWKDSTACDIDIGDNGIGTVDYETACRYMEKIGARGLGCYDYIQNGMRYRWIHIDCRGGTKSFWRCNNSAQKLTKISTFLLPYPIPTRNLKWIKKIWIFRMHGSDVKWLQTALNMSKLAVPLKVDGDFGEATDLYVRRYQASRKLTVDGIAGANTVNKLREDFYL